MNRRRRLGGLVILALVLFAFPLVSPVPTQDPAVEVLRDPNSTAEPQPAINETIQYQNLSSDAQQWFEELPQSEQSYAAEVFPVDGPPEPWASFVPNGSEANEQFNETRRLWSVLTYTQVEKDGRYHRVILWRIEPRPPQQAVALRLGSLIGSIGLFGLAGQQWLEGKR
ncbi:hypothetical protein [Halocatena salina]|uniref:Uncharacterized protein n=1 Tax=Halocatena salina TaxID=2934340 RepID=A0A8U0AAK8_9EURY|nr:hypothetical protein [Halocatena salina]UPM44973.1 hypothetical protein MW046_18105 [Halocatena salina]